MNKEERLNIDKLNRWLSLGANVGVLVGIVFLAIEISQNTQVNRSIASDAIINGTREQLMAPTQDMQLLELIVRSGNGEELSLLESTKLGFYHESFLRHLENAYLQHENGLLDSDLFQSLETDVWAMTQRSEFARNMWAMNKGNFSPKFQLYVDNIPDRE